MYCICCKKNNVVPIDTTTAKNNVSLKIEEEILWGKNSRKDGSFVNVNTEMIDNGIIHIIDAGYGSTHDGDQIILAICDDCIRQNLEDATLLYYGNYMLSDVVEEVENSTKKYRRRKKLDDLV